MSLLPSGLTLPPGPVSGDPAPLRIGFLSSHNPFDRTSFSGSAWHAVTALSAHPRVDLQVLGGHRPVRRWRKWARLAVPPVALPRDFGDIDVLLRLVATDLLNALPADFPTPILHVTDATVPFLRETYGWQIAASADAAETRVIARTGATIYSSHLMATWARREQGVELRQALAVPFGINFEDTPATYPEKPPLAPLRLLFVGLDCARKRSDLAVETLDRLRAAGHAATLTVVGRIPAHVRRHPGVRAAGMLDKNRPRARQRLSRLFAALHLLLLPTRGDCTPMVLAEAIAHGTPVLASAVRGIPELVGTGGAGRLLPAVAHADYRAATVLEMTGDPVAYALLSDSAFDRAATQFSWAAWAQRIVRIARQAAQSRSANAA